MFHQKSNEPLIDIIERLINNQKQLEKTTVNIMVKVNQLEAKVAGLTMARTQIDSSGKNDDTSKLYEALTKHNEETKELLLEIISRLDELVAACKKG